jgi:hypothetical protein
MKITLILAIAGGVALLLVVVLLLRLLVARKRGEGEARARALAADQELVLVDNMANCLGVESGGRAQARGNGCLVLSTGRLVFAMWVPRRDLVIPRDQILGVERVTSHLGRSVAVPLVKVRFRNPDGAEDAVAWVVRGADAWIDALGPSTPGSGPEARGAP